MADSESTQSKSTKRSAAAQTDDAQDKKAPPANGGGGGNGEDAPTNGDDGGETPSIPVGQLIAEGSGLLGYPSHVVAGGLSGHADADEEMPIDVAKAEVEAWLQQPVQLDPREGEE